MKWPGYLVSCAETLPNLASGTVAHTVYASSVQFLSEPYVLFLSPFTGEETEARKESVTQGPRAEEK